MRTNFVIEQNDFDLSIISNIFIAYIMYEV